MKHSMIGQQLFRAVRDSLGDLAQQRTAQRQIAEDCTQIISSATRSARICRYWGLNRPRMKNTARCILPPTAPSLVRVSDGLNT